MKSLRHSQNAGTQGSFQQMDQRFGVPKIKLNQLNFFPLNSDSQIELTLLDMEHSDEDAGHTHRFPVAMDFRHHLDFYSNENNSLGIC